VKEGATFGVLHQEGAHLRRGAHHHFVDLCTLGGVPHVLSLLSTCGKVIWLLSYVLYVLFCT
jgi:hypothetical protein